MKACMPMIINSVELLTTIIIAVSLLCYAVKVWMNILQTKNLRSNQRLYLETTTTIFKSPQLKPNHQSALVNVIALK